MDPRQNLNWPPQAYPNGQYVPYTPQQQQQQQQRQQQQPANGHQHPAYPPQYGSMQGQMPQGYAQPQFQQPYPHAAVQQTMSQPYHGMHQAYPQQPQQQPRAQPQVVIPPKQPPKNLNYVSPMQQMHAPKIRHVQRPVQRTSSTGAAQTNGSGDRRRYSNQQATMAPQSKQVQRSQAHQENAPRSQQQPAHATPQNHQTYRAPLQQQSTPQQRVPSSSQTPSSQHRSPSVQAGIKPSAHPQVVIPARSSSNQVTPSKQAHVPPKQLPDDLAFMLQSAADEYITAARSIGAMLLRNQQQADVEQYHRLMAMGLGCLHAILTGYNMPPRDEAKLRLRYACLLIEETDSTEEIDDVLAKLIALCGRCRFQDLKYAALHLQARYQFKTNHRATLKSLDKPISEAETFQHIDWVYAFRFLKVSLALQVTGRLEVTSALQQLRAISAHAKRRGDGAVYVVSNVLEAMVHLRSDAAEKLEQAQRAIADARSRQLELVADQLGSFGILLNMIDLACCIHNGAPDNAKSTAVMAGALEGANASTWLSDTGIVTVPIEHSVGGSLTTDTGGIFRRNSAGRDELVFSWLPKKDLGTLCTYLSALDKHVHARGVGYLKDAHQAAQHAVERPVLRHLPMSLSVAQQHWNHVLDWHALFAMVLVGCYWDDQAMADEALSILKLRATRLPQNSGDNYTRMLLYATAVCEQRTGSFDSAVRTYSASVLQLPQPGSAANAQSDLAILAALNKVLIIRAPGHPQHDSVASLLAGLKPLCNNHPNQYIRTAYRLSHAMSHPEVSTEASISQKKNKIQTSCTTASAVVKSTGNSQFMTMALNAFTESFFINDMTKQGYKAVLAAKVHSRKTKSALWNAVALGLCMHNFQLCGLVQEAQEAQREYESLMPLLPAPLLSRPTVDEERDDADAEGEDEDAEGEDDDD